MWSNRKARFTVIMSVILGANLALWLADRLSDFTLKEHAKVFLFIYMLDFSTILGLALLGLLTAWLLAFRPEAFKLAIERSIAKRNSS